MSVHFRMVSGEMIIKFIFVKWVLVAEYAHLLERIANPSCRSSLRHISVFSKLREPICGLYCNYAQHALATVSLRDRNNGTRSVGSSPQSR